jgi:hypothetical protein
MADASAYLAKKPMSDADGSSQYPSLTNTAASRILVVEWLGVVCWQWVIEATSFNIDYCNRAVMCLVVGDKCEMLLELRSKRMLSNEIDC